MVRRWPFFADRTYSASSSPRTTPLVVVLVVPRLNSTRLGSALPPRCAVAVPQRKTSNEPQMNTDLHRFEKHNSLDFLIGSDCPFIQRFRKVLSIYLRKSVSICG